MDRPVGQGLTLADVLNDLDYLKEEERNSLRNTLGPFIDHPLSAFYQNGQARPTMKALQQLSQELTGFDAARYTLFLTSCQMSSEKNFKRRRLLPAHEVFSEVVSPSEFGKASGWTNNQQTGTEIMCLRPATSALVNVRIMHPVFHQMVTMLNSGQPEPRDFMLATELASVMPSAFSIEDKRRDEINTILSNHLLDPNDSAKSGVNIVCKNEKGQGEADPYMENIGYYTHYWATNDGPTKHCCPWILVGVVGQEIGLSGAVWACNRPCAQPLSSNVPFLPVPCDRDMWLMQARICMALRHGSTELRKFYESPRLASSHFSLSATFRRKWSGC